MAHRYPLEHGNLIAYHVLPPCHHPLIDDFGRKVPPGVDMNTFFNDRVGSRTQSLSSLVPARLYLGFLLQLLILLLMTMVSHWPKEIGFEIPDASPACSCRPVTWRYRAGCPHGILTLTQPASPIVGEYGSAEDMAISWKTNAENYGWGQNRVLGRNVGQRAQVFTMST